MYRCQLQRMYDSLRRVDRHPRGVDCNIRSELVLLTLAQCSAGRVAVHAVPWSSYVAASRPRFMQQWSTEKTAACVMCSYFEFGKCRTRAVRVRESANECAFGAARRPGRRAAQDDALRR